jgi:2,3-bisphosphoglycerate-independent phosphoglycerate mutase
MKYVIVRCEDGALAPDQASTLLQGARVPHLQQLAQAGTAGLIRFSRDQDAIDRFRLHRACFGLDPDEPDALPGRCYAAALNRGLDPEERAWCCEFVTQRDGRFLDPDAGQITTKESQILVGALEEGLGSEIRRWQLGDGPHQLLVTRDPALAPPRGGVRSPELLIGQDWRRALPKGELGKALRGLIEEASAMLEAHPVNRVRVDLGENPANMIWLWGGSAARPTRTFTERTGLSGAVVSRSFLLRGLAQSLGLAWKDAPGSFEDSALLRLFKTVTPLLERHDFVYIHLRVQSAKPVERLCAMERIDRLLLKPLTDVLPTRGPWRLLAAVDDRTRRVVPLIAIGTGLPQRPVTHLSAEAFAESALAFDGGSGLFTWFVQAPERAGLLTGR